MPVLTALVAVFAALLGMAPFTKSTSTVHKGRHTVHRVLLNSPGQPGTVGLHQQPAALAQVQTVHDLAVAAADEAGRSSSSPQLQQQYAVAAGSSGQIAQHLPEHAPGAATVAWPPSSNSHKSKPGTRLHLIEQPGNHYRRLFGGGGQPGGDQCGPLREKQECTPDGCLWCANKYSPWAGSDGVCVSEDQAKYLPDITYDCAQVPPVRLDSRAVSTPAA